MLEEVSVKNLGVIKEAKLTFGPGLTTITGETGAGKTMVLTALNLLLGRRSDSSFVRHDSESASVQGCWVSKSKEVAEIVSQAGGDIEDGLLYINRTVTKEGKSRSSVGGKNAPAATLNGIADYLVAIHGQSDQIRLKSPAAQREALDDFAKNALKEKLSEYSIVFKEYQSLTKQIKDIETNAFAREIEFNALNTMISEYEKLSPEEGEDEILKNEITKLENLEIIKNKMELISMMLSSDGDSTDISSLVSRITKELNEIAEYDTELAEMLALSDSIKALVSELSVLVGSYFSNINIDDIIKLNQMQERLYALNAFSKKYGGSLEIATEVVKQAHEKVKSLGLDLDIEEIKSKHAEIKAKLDILAKDLTEIRTTSAAELSSLVNGELVSLNMANSKLIIDIKRLPDFTSYGLDEVSFMLKHGSNDARPLSKGASGGELSRVMLGLEVVLADPEKTPTFVFDEVDSGIGGSTAIEVGKRLSKLAEKAQVIVVTHLPQVAAFGDSHIRVLKTSTEDYISTDVKSLDKEERLQELSRMLSGLEKSDTARAHAEELLAFASEFKTSVDK